MTGESDIRRSLSPYSPVRRNPHDMLRRMLERVPAGTSLWDEDAPVAQLERRVADLLGKPRALFFPTGTMAQQVALRIHAERTGRPTFTAHPSNHLDLWEQRGYAVVHGLRFEPAGHANTPLTLEDLEAVGERVGALLIELPQRQIGGTLPTWDELLAQVAWARDRGAAVHLDGARLWESQPFYGRPHAEIASLFDTVYVSLYKGLEGVRGAILAGEADVIAEADVWRQRLGGAIPDAWPLAVSAAIGLDELLDRMPAFYEHAVALADAIHRDGVASVVPNPPRTPMFHVHLPVPATAAMAVKEQLIADQGIYLFNRAKPMPLPDWSSFEVHIGETGMDFTPDEVAALIRDLVDRARKIPES